jgi:hypothetical protein
MRMVLPLGPDLLRGAGERIGKARLLLLRWGQRSPSVFLPVRRWPLRSWLAHEISSVGIRDRR